MPDYLTAEEVADILGYSVQYVRRMLRNGKLRADKKARVWLVYRSSVEEYKQTVEGLSKHDPRRSIRQREAADNGGE
jgi:excisionase family DNA binding protein